MIDGEVKKEEKTIASSALTNMESLIICEVPDEDKNSAFGDYGDSSDDDDDSDDGSEIKDNVGLLKTNV